MLVLGNTDKGVMSMAGRERKVYGRKLVAYRLMESQLQALDNASRAIKKSKTAIVEQAIGMYLNQLHISGVI